MYTDRSQTLHCASTGTAVKYLIRGQKCLSDKCMNMLVECSIILTTVLPHGHSLSGFFFFFRGCSVKDIHFDVLHFMFKRQHQINPFATDEFGIDGKSLWAQALTRVMRATEKWDIRGRRAGERERERDSEVETASRRERRGVRMHW